MEKLTKAQKKIISLLKANPEARVAMNKYSGTSHDGRFYHLRIPDQDSVNIRAKTFNAISQYLDMDAVVHSYGVTQRIYKLRRF